MHANAPPVSPRPTFKRRRPPTCIFYVQAHKQPLTTATFLPTAPAENPSPRRVLQHGPRQQKDVQEAKRRRSGTPLRAHDHDDPVICACGMCGLWLVRLPWAGVAPRLSGRRLPRSLPSPSRLCCDACWLRMYCAYSCEFMPGEP